MLEELRVGRTRITQTSDYTDIQVINAHGCAFTWTEVSRLNDDDMHNLMREVVNKLFIFQTRIFGPDYQAMVDRWLPSTQTGMNRFWKRAARGASTRVDWRRIALSQARCFASKPAITKK